MASEPPDQTTNAQAPNKPGNAEPPNTKKTILQQPSSFPLKRTGKRN